MCVCVRVHVSPHRVEQATGLADLRSVIGQFRLQAVVLIQQVGDQDVDQVGAARTR